MTSKNETNDLGMSVVMAAIYFWPVTLPLAALAAVVVYKSSKDDEYTEISSDELIDA